MSLKMTSVLSILIILYFGTVGATGAVTGASVGLPVGLRVIGDMLGVAPTVGPKELGCACGDAIGESLLLSMSVLLPPGTIILSTSERSRESQKAYSCSSSSDLLFSCLVVARRCRVSPDAMSGVKLLNRSSMAELVVTKNFMLLVCCVTYGKMTSTIVMPIFVYGI